MIDLSTAASLEIIKNLQNPKSRDCLFGLLNETLTPMGSRLLRINILQPPIAQEKIAARHDAVEELSTKEDIFFAVRDGNFSFHCGEMAILSVDSTEKYSRCRQSSHSSKFIACYVSKEESDNQRSR